MAKLSKLYTMQEAAEHNTRDDCWVVIEGKVYDVSSYLDDHPGGDDVLLTATGKDATEEFEDAGHSKSARELMEEFCIGELEALSIPELEISSSQSPLSPWAVSATVVGVAAVVLGIVLWRRRPRSEPSNE